MSTPEPESLALVAAAIAAVSGLPGLFGWARGASGQRVAAGLCTVAAVLALVAAGRVLAGPGGDAPGLQARWGVPGGVLALRLDALSALFLLPVAVVGALCTVYACGYLGASEPATPRVGALFGVLLGSLIVVLLARSGVVFLAAWEVMAVSAFGLIATEHHRAGVRDASWVYLVATHAGTLCLWALFALFLSGAGTFGFTSLEGASPVVRGAVVGLALAGFGLKAGLMPLHFWLPGAHAAAPSHVSALLSAVMLKAGVYGLVRVLSLVPAPPVALGGLLLLAGTVSAVGGVAYALAQHDLKRLLAYHSIENVGIIVMGLGLATLGRARGRPDLVALGLAGGLLHVVNHAIFKALLFFAAGGIAHATGTRVLDRLGGLARGMPRTALTFAVGAVAICGLPPLNGFVSELLVYLGLFTALGPSGGSSSLAALAAPALALTGALALACFVKVFGVVFLGTPRSPAAAAAREVPASMTGPMGVLALLCVLLGVAPAFAAPALDRAVTAFAPEIVAPRLLDLAPLLALSGVAAGLLGLIAAVWWFVSRARRWTVASTWGCGYAGTGPRLQYTASSFADLLVGRFPGLRIDGMLERRLRPATSRIARACSALQGLQTGRPQLYVLYILATVVVALAWTLPLGDLVEVLWTP